MLNKLQTKQCSAFTLIELLVVVAVIALLIAILLPSLHSARRQAMNAKCMSNMRQIVSAVTMYLPNNRDWFPSIMDTSGGFPQTKSWWAIDSYQSLLGRYMDQERGGVELAASSAGKRTVWFEPTDPDQHLPAMWGSFEHNGLITDLPRVANQIAQPAATVYLTLREQNWTTACGVGVPDPLPLSDPNHAFWSSEFFDMGADPWATTGNPSDGFHWRQGRAAPPYSLFPTDPDANHWDEQLDGRDPGVEHPAEGTRYGGGRMPFAFCDGHVANMKFEQTYYSGEVNLWDIR